ncbi:MAG: lyase, partial [Nitrosopumilaceae archaeon]|nr:lyase [Nitrosopumilaceae archaeon]
MKIKKQYKGLFFLVVFGGGLLFWATAASMPGMGPPDEETSTMTITGTPADNFPDEER